MNVTVLDKEFFRRKLLKNHENTTGMLLRDIQENFHILLNHLSFEEAHFQAYVMTAPHYEFNFLAVESDNVTVEKLTTSLSNTLTKFYRSDQRVFTYSIYSFKNFIYKDQIGEEKMDKYIHELSLEALSLQMGPFKEAFITKFQSEWPHPGMDASTTQDVEIVHAPYNPEKRENDEAHLPGRPEFNDPKREVPVYLTKDKIVCSLNSPLVV